MSKLIVQWSSNTGESLIKVKLPEIEIIKAVDENWLFVSNSNRINMLQIVENQQEKRNLREELKKEMQMADNFIQNKYSIDNIWLEKEIEDFE